MLENWANERNITRCEISIQDTNLSSNLYATLVPETKNDVVVYIKDYDKGDAKLRSNLLFSLCDKRKVPGKENLDVLFCVVTIDKTTYGGRQPLTDYEMDRFPTNISLDEEK